MCNNKTVNVFDSHVNEYIQYRINSSCKDNERAAMLLRRLREFEDSIGVSFQNFSEDQMSEFYKKNIIRSTPKQAAPKIKAIREYLLWMHENELIDNKTFLLHPFFRLLNMSPEDNGSTKTKATIKQVVSDVDHDFVKKTMIFSEEEFESYCETFFSKDSLEMEKAIYCLVWCGVPIGSLRWIRKDDFNVHDKSISFVSSIPYSDEKEKIVLQNDYCIKAIEKVINSSGYTIVRENGRKLTKQYSDEDDPYIIRRTQTKKEYSDNDNDDRLRGILAHICDKIKKEQKALPQSNAFKEKYVNLRNLYASGLFYRCYLMEDNKKAFEELGQFRWPSYVAWLAASDN